MGSPLALRSHYDIEAALNPVDGTEDRAHTARSDLTLDRETLREQLACDGGAMVLESVTLSRPSLSAMLWSAWICLERSEPIQSRWFKLVCSHASSGPDLQHDRPRRVVMRQSVVEMARTVGRNTVVDGRDTRGRQPAAP
jgi:hypothetical protein